MLTFLTIFATSFLIAFSGAAMPGPLMTATISESMHRGFITGPLLIAGHSMLEFALVVLLMFGLAPFLTQEWVFAAIAVIGSIMLVWMGLTMLRAVPSLSIRTDIQGGGGHHLIMTGVLMSLANPYWSLWWATIGLGYVLYCARYGYLGIVFFFIGHCLGDLTWYSAISFAIGKGRRFLSDNHYQALIGICGVFLILLACYFAWSGMNKALKL
ncbi:MAG: LysE family translocator [Desulfomonilia bacterium]